MRNLLVLIALATTALFTNGAMAADGSASLDFGTFVAGYDLEHNGMNVTGSQYNLGNGSGAVKLSHKDGRADGMWTGFFGSSRIEVRRTVTRDDGRMTVELVALPGGNYSFSIKKKSDTETEIYAILSAGRVVRANLEDNGMTFNSNNRSVNISLKSTDGRNFKGTTSVLRNGRYETSRTTLKTTGTLTPAALLAADPALFIVTYILPYNM
jgi:hypothetical protein